MGEARWSRNMDRYFRSLDWEALGVTDLDIALANLTTLRARRSSAFRAGFYVEAIALNATVIEFLLSLWYTAKTERRLARDDRLTLGGWITRVSREGFDPDVVVGLRQFNQVRRKAILRMLLGEATYDDLRQAYVDYEPLVGLVAARVVKDFEGRRPRAKS